MDNQPENPAADTVGRVPASPSTPVVQPVTAGGPVPAGNSGAASGSGRGKSTPEQRAKWKLAKQNQRLGKQAASPGLPPVLPSVAQSPAGEAGTLASPVGDSPAPEAPTVVPWTSDDLNDLVAELIALYEDWDKDSDVKLAKELKLTGEILKRVEADAEIPKFCKVIFQKHLPRVAAKALNKTGVSSDSKDEAALILAVAYLALDKMKRKKAIKKLSGEPETKTPETKPA